MKVSAKATQENIISPSEVRYPLTSSHYVITLYNLYNFRTTTKGCSELECGLDSEIEYVAQMQENHVQETSPASRSKVDGNNMQ